MRTFYLIVAVLGIVHGRKMMDNRIPPTLLRTARNDVPGPRFFPQRQDHFDPANNNTWQQAFYVNDTFFSGDAAPVFLCVGGEGPALDGSVVVNSVHCNVAVEWLKETGALMVALEHRYYGCHNASACPYGMSDEDPLRYLSSRQAVEDLATFHRSISEKYNLSNSNKWIAWGGSYPGMLASFFRIKHPELVHASVASSAPVIAQLDMPEYNNIAAQAYALASVGGSSACREAVAKGHADIGAMMKTSSGRESIAGLFDVEARSLITRAGQRGFAGEGVAYFPSQGNDPSCDAPACNIEKICRTMTDISKGDEVRRLSLIRRAQSQSQSLSENADEDSGKMRNNYSSEPLDIVSSLSSYDYWGYQTCTEFGFYQTCEVDSDCFYTQGLDLLDDQISFCLKDFGIPKEQIEKAINATNSFYGGAHPKATRIMYPNGDVDPWHGLSILSSPGPDLPVLMVSGASHHAWTHPSLPSDQKSVIAARTAIRQQVAAWLRE